MATVEFTSHRSEIEEGLSDAINMALETIGLRAERHAKAVCPYITGRLKNSISHARDENSAYIGTNVEYAPYVELGARGRDPKPYLKPAIENHVDEYKGVVKRALGG